MDSTVVWCGLSNGCVKASFVIVARWYIITHCVAALSSGTCVYMLHCCFAAFVLMQCRYVVVSNWICNIVCLSVCLCLCALCPLWIIVNVDPWVVDLYFQVLSWRLVHCWLLIITWLMFDIYYFAYQSQSQHVFSVTDCRQKWTLLKWLVHWFVLILCCLTLSSCTARFYNTPTKLKLTGQIISKHQCN